jgi:hypothetical protein
MAALAHAHHDDAPAAGQHEAHGAREAGTQPGLGTDQGGGLDVEGLRRKAQGARGIERRGRRGAGDDGSRGLLGGRF